jgi:hypothetical protein
MGPNEVAHLQDQLSNHMVNVPTKCCHYSFRTHICQTHICILSSENGFHVDLIQQLVWEKYRLKTHIFSL